MQNKIVAAALTATIAIAVWQKSRAAEPATAPSGVTVRGSVHTIQLPEPEYILPSAPGRETVQQACAICHTNRYIMIQPPLSKATWIAEVTKMRKVFSAPIPEEKVAEIVDYLVAVRGADVAGRP